MKNNAAFLINSLAGGGAERVVSTLLNNFIDDYDCTLIVFDKTIDYDLDPRINIVSLDMQSSSGIVNFLLLPILAFKLSKVMKRLDIKVLVSFLHRANYVNCLSKLFSSHKVVISERIASSSLYADGSLLSKVSNFLVRHLYAKADLIISVSHAIKMDLQRNYNISVKQEVIYNPYDIELIHSKSKELVEIDMKNAVVTVGSLSKRKGHAGLLKAFSLLSCQDTQLVILGVGDQLDTLTALSETYGIASRVTFLGFDSNPYKYLAKAKMFVLNSESEGFPNVLAEALVCGCAAISTDCLSGPREILAPGTDYTHQLKDGVELAKYGVLVPTHRPDMLHDAFESLIHDEEKLHSLRQSAYEAIHTFSIEQIASRYLEVINGQVEDYDRSR